MNVCPCAVLLCPVQLQALRRAYPPSEEFSQLSVRTENPGKAGDLGQHWSVVPCKRLLSTDSASWWQSLEYVTLRTLRTLRTSCVSRWGEMLLALVNTVSLGFESREADVRPYSAVTRLWEPCNYCELPVSVE